MDVCPTQADFRTSHNYNACSCPTATQTTLKCVLRCFSVYPSCTDRFHFPLSLNRSEKTHRDAFIQPNTFTEGDFGFKANAKYSHCPKAFLNECIYSAYLSFSVSLRCAALFLTKSTDTWVARCDLSKYYRSWFSCFVECRSVISLPPTQTVKFPHIFHIHHRKGSAEACPAEISINTAGAKRLEAASQNTRFFWKSLCRVTAEQIGFTEAVLPQVRCMKFLFRPRI